MMKKISFAAILFALAMFVAAPLAHATTVTEVQAMITQLKGKVRQSSLSPASTPRRRIVRACSVKAR